MKISEYVVTNFINDFSSRAMNRSRGRAAIREMTALYIEERVYFNGDCKSKAITLLSR